MYCHEFILNPYTRPIHSTYVLDLYTGPIYWTYILDLYTRPIYFGLADAPLVQVQVLTHVGEVGRGHKHVVLWADDKSTPLFFDAQIIATNSN